MSLATGLGMPACAILLCGLCGRAAAGAEAQPPLKIHVDHARHGFVDSAGKPFVPFGVSYYRPGSGWAPQVWKKFDPEGMRRDFEELKRLGCNVVRVFVSMTAFYSKPGQLDPEGLAKFDRFLDLADEAGIYVHPTGPGGWEGMPPWTNGLDICDPKYLDGLAAYWRLFAARYRGRNTIWAYDLQNEPSINWDTPCMRTLWAEWRRKRHREPVPIPDPKGGNPALIDFQHFRESLGTRWVEVQAKAIRAADPDALITTGLIQWSVPAQRLGLGNYAAFRPSKIARYLDFMEIHYYPLATGAYRYESADAESANLAVAESMAREAARPGLPLVIAEFGWYGGGPLDKGGEPATEQQQADWCRHLVEVTAPLACGWLNWGMHDEPDAGDVSVLTGLYTVDGRLKEWGREFGRLAAHYSANPPGFKMPERPELPWEQCIVSGDAMEQFRKAYLAAFLAAHPPAP
jgi:hypothetical protein